MIAKTLVRPVKMTSNRKMGDIPGEDKTKFDNSETASHNFDIVECID